MDPNVTNNLKKTNAFRQSEKTKLYNDLFFMK